MYRNNVCALMNKCNIKSNNISKEKWKCNIILEMLDWLYSLSNCGFSIDEGKHCLIYAVWYLIVAFTVSILCSICIVLSCFFLLFLKIVVLYFACQLEMYVLTTSSNKWYNYNNIIFSVLCWCLKHHIALCCGHRFSEHQTRIWSSASMLHSWMSKELNC